jgi:hypothetical protein
VNERLQAETERLRQSWERHESTMLRDYLVADVEDPRLNVQSILSRHFVVEALVGDRFAALREQELRFAVALNWLQRWSKRGADAEDLAALRHALGRGADNVEGVQIPRFLSEACTALPVPADGLEIPNYLDALLSGAAAEAGSLPAEILATFQTLWQRALREEPPSDLSLVEPACGSANDYRFLDAFGLARLIRYTGFDLCEKNVANARSLFPTTRFEVGNVLEIHAPEKAFDLCIVHDLFEHLSPEAMEAAVEEISRVTRRGLCLGFFNMQEEPAPIIRPVDEYHWNTLSMSVTRSLFERRGFTVQVLHIGTFLKWSLGCGETHNDSAYTFVGRAIAAESTRALAVADPRRA